MPDAAIDFSKLKHVKPGNTIILRFRENAIRHLRTLRDMDRKGIIELTPGQRVTLQAITSSNDWGTDPSNRTFSVHVGLNWHEQQFRSHTSSLLESLEVHYS